MLKSEVKLIWLWNFSLAAQVFLLLFVASVIAVYVFEFQSFLGIKSPKQFINYGSFGFFKLLSAGTKARTCKLLFFWLLYRPKQTYYYVTCFSCGTSFTMVAKEISIIALVIYRLTHIKNTIDFVCLRNGSIQERLQHFRNIYRVLIICL